MLNEDENLRIKIPAIEEHEFFIEDAYGGPSKFSPFFPLFYHC